MTLSDTQAIQTKGQRGIGKWLSRRFPNWCYSTIGSLQHSHPIIMSLITIYISTNWGCIAAYCMLTHCHSSLLEAMKMVHGRYPELMLVVAGGGKYYFDIEPYKELDYVRIINHYIGTRELAGMLRACEFGVCPYKDATQSGVIQTAFTLEVPMVVTNVGALAIAVQHDKTGIVVRPCDVNDLANGIVDLYSDKRKLNAMRKNIKDEWMKNMSWEPIADEYLKCYKA